MQAHVHNQEEGEETEEATGEAAEKEAGKAKGKGGKEAAKEGSAEKPKEKKETKIMSVEERDVGSVSWRVYQDYCLAIGGVILSSTILMLYIADQTAQVGSSWYGEDLPSLY